MAKVRISAMTKVRVRAEVGLSNLVIGVGAHPSSEAGYGTLINPNRALILNPKLINTQTNPRSDTA